MKVRALKAFEGTRDKIRDVYPKEGDVWEVSEERGNFLKEHGVVEIVEEIPEIEESKEEIEEVEEKIEEIPKKKKKKKILK